MVEKEKKEIKYFVKVDNRWFYTRSEILKERYENNFARKYGARGFMLQVKLLQTRTNRNKYFVDLAYIKDWFNYSKKEYIQKVLKLLQQFNDKDIIKFTGKYNIDVSNMEHIYFTPNEEFPEKYFILYDYEIDRILVDYNGKLNKQKLLLLFGCLKSHYNTEHKICYPTIMRISLETKMSEKTILEGIKTLENLGLILYSNLGTKLFADGTIREADNVYTMNYEGNEKILNEYLEKELLKVDDEGAEIVKRETANARRSIKMKIRHLQDKYEEGKITKKQYDREKDKLETQHKKLLRKEFTLTRKTL